MSDIADNYGVSPSSAPGQGIKEAKKQGGVYNFLTGKVRIPKRKKLKARDRKGEYNFTIYFDDGTSVQAYHDTEFGGTFVHVDGSMKKLERYIEENNLTIDEEQTLPEIKENAPPLYGEFMSLPEEKRVQETPQKLEPIESIESTDPGLVTINGKKYRTQDVPEEYAREVYNYFVNDYEGYTPAYTDKMLDSLKKKFKTKKTSLINEDETSLVNQEDEEKYQVPRSGGLRFNAIG